MKSALNGGLNLSIRDGWWDEWYDGADGWAIPSADGVEDPGRRDELESHALYELLSQTVAPRFYDTGADGLPRRWLEMVGHTLRASARGSRPPGWSVSTWRSCTSPRPRRSARSATGWPLLGDLAAWAGRSRSRPPGS